MSETKPCDLCEKPTPTMEPASRWCDDCRMRVAAEYDAEALESMLRHVRRSDIARRRGQPYKDGSSARACAANVIRRLAESWM